MPRRTCQSRGGRRLIYIDLCDEEWRAVSVSRTEWKLVSSPLVRFRRTSGMLQLPIPRPGGSVESLRQFINIKADDDFKLVVAFVLSALRGRGPYPVLVLVGEQGSAKSTLIKMIRSLIDPNKAPVRSSPREKRDLFVSAGDCHLLAFETSRSCPTGFRTRCASSRPAEVFRHVSSTPTERRCSSPRRDQSR